MKIHRALMLVVLVSLGLFGLTPCNAAAATMSGNPSADLAVTQFAAPSPVPFNRPFTLTVVVTNLSGPSTVDALLRVAMSGVSLGTIAVPFGWSCSTVPGGFECRNPAYAPSPFSSSFIVEVTHGRPIGSSIAANAQVSSSVPDPDTSNNSASLALAVSGAYADLSVDLEGGRGQVRPDNDIDYELFVFNGGSSDASAAFIDIPLPPGTTFVSFTRLFGTSPPWACSTPAVGMGGSIRCDMAVFPRSSGTFFNLVTRASASAVGSILSASASIGSATPDSDLSDNSATVISLVQSGSEAADVVLTISDSPDPVLPGGEITYTLTLTNNGPDTAAHGLLQINFPEADDIDMTLPVGWTCEFLVPPPVVPPPPGVAYCERRVFPVGVAIFRFVVRTRPTDTGQLRLTASAHGATNDPNASDNAATATTTLGFATAAQVPALSPALLAVLALMLLGFGASATARPR